MDGIQPIYPHTLWQRLCARLHREPVSHIAHWDQKLPERLPTFDVEAEWIFIAGHIERLAVDEAHGDLADRLVEARVEAFRHRLNGYQLRRDETLARLQSQGKGKVVTLRQLVRDLRSDLDTATAEHSRAYHDVHGVEPVAATADLPVQAHALPARSAETDSTRDPDTDSTHDPDSPTPSVSLHSVRPPSPVQPEHGDSTNELDRGA